MTNFEMNDLEMYEEMFSDTESVGSVELEPYMTYDEEMQEFIDASNDWMHQNNDDDEIVFNSVLYEEELPDIIEERGSTNLTPEMRRLLDRLYPGDVDERV